MKENLINLSFSVTGYIVQDIVLITDETIAADEMVRMLNAGEAFTAVHEDNDVIMSDGAVIGSVRWSDTELEFNNFRIEGGDYEQDAPKPKEFNATHLAFAGAVGDYIDEPEMSITEVLYSLEASGTDLPSLQVVEAYETLTANKLLKEIRLTAQGLSSLMEVAYNAGKSGQEII